MSKRGRRVNAYTRETRPEDEKEVLQSIVDQIQKELDWKGMTRGHLAELIGTTPGNVAHVLRRKGNLTVGSVVTFARVLGLRVKVELVPKHEGPVYQIRPPRPRKRRRRRANVPVRSEGPDREGSANGQREGAQHPARKGRGEERVRRQGAEGSTLEAPGAGHNVRTPDVPLRDRWKLNM